MSQVYLARGCQMKVILVFPVILVDSKFDQLNVNSVTV